MDDDEWYESRRKGELTIHHYMSDDKQHEDTTYLNRGFEKQGEGCGKGKLSIGRLGLASLPRGKHQAPRIMTRFVRQGKRRATSQNRLLL